MAMIQEYTLDYVFAKLGIDTDRISHPVLMTEPICNPAYSRKLVSELLFEGYQAPSVAYGVDALFSYHVNGRPMDAGGIIISSGHNSTSILPVLGGRGVFDQCKRISYGGSNASEYMLKLLQVKYPTFPHKVTGAQAQTMVKEHTYVANDYIEELRKYADPKQLGELDRAIQFPYVEKVDEQEAQAAAERLAAKRREQAQALRDRAARIREEKLKEKETYLEELKELQESKSRDKLPPQEFLARLKAYGINTGDELESEIKATESAIRRIRNRILGIVEPEEKEKPSFPLVDVPDDQLTEEEKKEKKKQRLLKASFDARERMKREKEAEKAREEELLRQEEERRLKDPEAWLEEVRQQRQ
ncbi:Nuclear actin-protein involved in chromatin remodeling, partial [Borealophlyctis nickersoniae]